MAKIRKDKCGNILRKGECYRVDIGKYTFHHVDAAGIKHVIYSNTLIELRIKEEKWRIDRENGFESPLNEKVSVNDVFERYFSQSCGKETDCQNTNENIIYECYVREEFGTRRINKVSWEESQRFCQKLIRENGGNYNVALSVFNILDEVFRKALGWLIIEENPIADVKDWLKNSKSAEYALTNEQMNIFLNFSFYSKVYSRWFLLYITCFATGCRLCEILGLRWQDINFEENYITVNQAILYKQLNDGKTGYVIVEADKRKIPLLSSLKTALERELAVRQSEEAEGYLFCNRAGEYLNTTVINRAIKRTYQVYNRHEMEASKKEKRKTILLPEFKFQHIRNTFFKNLKEVESDHHVIQMYRGKKPGKQMK